jgi:hypothetical protein
MDSFRAEQHDDDAMPRELTRCQRDAALVGWVSFLVASAATMVFFAWIDPAQLATIADAPLPDDRMAGYAIGFFFFWALCAMSTALAVCMIRTRHRNTPPRE